SESSVPLRRSFLRIERGQSSCFAWQIARLLVTRERFLCGTRSFALRGFFLLYTLLFLAARACCPPSFSSISTVVWLEWHHDPLLRRLISFRTIHNYITG